MLKVLPVSGPLIGENSLKSLKASGILGYYDPLIDGDLAFVVTPENGFFVFRFVIFPSPQFDDIPRIVVPTEWADGELYDGNGAWQMCTTNMYNVQNYMTGDGTVTVENDGPDKVVINSPEYNLQGNVTAGNKILVENDGPGKVKISYTG